MGLWNTIKKAAKGVGKFVSKNWKTIVGVAAAVVIPFAAPAIGGMLAGSAFLGSIAPGVASFLGSGLGAGMIGAGLGAGAAALTGQNPLLGAALGGVGGYAGSALGLGGMFGGGAAGAAAGGMGSAATIAPAVAPSAGLINLGGVTATAGGIPIGATSVGAAGGAAAAGGLSLGSIASSLASNPQAIGALGQLAMVMFNKDVTELTAEEEAQLKEVAAQAATNRALFERKVEEARKLIAQGTPNPEQAYANARFSVENQMEEARRGQPAGLQEASARKEAIAGAQLGTQGVAVDDARAAQVRVAGLNALPDEAPTGYNQLAMPTYNSLYERRNDYEEQKSKALGNLFGSFA